MFTRGFAAPEVNAAFEQTRGLIEHAEALGERPEDPWVVFSVLLGFFMANFVAFNAGATREIATQCLSLAERQGAPIPLRIGHSLLGGALVVAGDFSGGRAHLDRAAAICEPDVHDRLIAARFGFDPGTVFLPLRACAQWLLGFPRPHAQMRSKRSSMGAGAITSPPWLRCCTSRGRRS
jgi:hypothetical protein